MKLDQFTFFAAVAKHLNLTKASAELRVSQPWISQQLKQLEDHYGTKLYRRLSKGVEITDAGRLLLRNITPILEQVAMLEHGFKTSAAPKIALEVLRVGGIDSASAHLLPAVLAQFKRRHARMELDFRTRTSEHLERLVLNLALDLAVTGREALSAALVCEPLRQERVALFVPANHPLAKRARLRLADVLAEPLIVRGGRGGSGVTDRALQQLREQGLEIRIGLHCDGPTAIKAAVRQKMGVGVVFEESLKAEVAAGEFKILNLCGLELMGESFIIYSKTRPFSPLAQEFLDLLRHAVKKSRRVAEPSAEIPLRRAPQRPFPVSAVMPQILER